MSQVVSYDFPTYLTSCFTPQQQSKRQPIHTLLPSASPKPKATPPRAKTNLGNYTAPFAYQEVAFPVPKNTEDLDSVTLHQCYDYAKAESPRSRYRTNFYREWADRRASGFKRARGLCTQEKEVPLSPRYRKGELEALRNYKLLRKEFLHRVKTPAQLGMTSPSPHTSVQWTKLRRESINSMGPTNEEIKEFEEKLPVIKGNGRCIYDLSALY